MNRETWLGLAVDRLQTIFGEAGFEVPSVYVSVGWPGGRGKKTGVIGQCWPTSTSSDGRAHVFVSPVLDNPVDVLSTLTHELVHAVDDCKSKHKGAFTRIAQAVGLEGKMTETTPGDVLRARLQEIADELGDYPHAKMVPAEGATKQTTRMLKVICRDSGYTVRTTRKWLDEYGEPLCPCHQEMMEEA